jgi:hypothetical protein
MSTCLLFCKAATWLTMKAAITHGLKSKQQSRTGGNQSSNQTPRRCDILFDNSRYCYDHTHRKMLLNKSVQANIRPIAFTKLHNSLLQAPCARNTAAAERHATAQQCKTMKQDQPMSASRMRSMSASRMRSYSAASRCSSTFCMCQCIRLRCALVCDSRLSMCLYAGFCVRDS